MIILGVNAYHGDSAACLLEDGRLVAAAEEERFRRVKHWAGFPSEAIRYCLREARCGLADVEAVAVNRAPRANLWRKVGYALLRRPARGLLLDRLRNARKWASLREQFVRAFPGQRLRAEIHHVEHHLAHLASAFLVSGFEEAAVLSVDGFGDFASAAWGLGRAAHIDVQGRVYFPHSLGIFYQALTQYLGFAHYGDEYKVMGLAPYGEPRFTGQLERLVSLEPDGSFRLDLGFFRHHREDVSYTWEECAPAVGDLFSPALEGLLGPRRQPGEPLGQRHKDIARSTQATYERAFFHLLRALHERCGCPSLALAGGCAMNSVANGKVYEQTPFRRMYIQSAAGDAGGAVGAAFVAWHRLRGATRGFVMDHAFWGPQFGEAELRGLLRAQGAELARQGCRSEQVEEEAELCERTAQAVAAGKVVGWFQGRMEWGPRALGNRSILCDPRRADIRDLLNLKIKRRESFRPFAPSILREAVPDWFETDDDVPFMMRVYRIREEKRPLIPAVTHVDGSGRLQTAHPETNPRYYNLIKAFEGLTGVPLVLNTSFNENEPVVCRPQEALDCFLRTKMDLLVLGNSLIERA